jgi:alpha-mannosidase
VRGETTMTGMRLARFVRERLLPAQYPVSVPVEIGEWTVRGEPVPFADAVTREFRPFPVGREWGVPWDTTWFRIRGEVPADWPVDERHRPEVVMDLGFTGRYVGFQAEGLVYRPDGTVVKGIEPLNAWVPVRGAFELYVEAAANPNIGESFKEGLSHLGDPATVGDEPIYTLKALGLSLRDTRVWELVQDVWTASGLLAELPAESTRAVLLRTALDRMVDVMDPDDIAGTVEEGRAALADVLAAPAVASAHRSIAVGHAHIDSAWLWPARETVRKIARTFSNVLDLMDTDPELVFAASSAQQYAWLKERHPDLYDRMRRRIDEGRFIPVGGTWVENDTNLPSGESLARQFVAGKRFFLDEFGVEPREAWYPDSFGYTAALPQIIRAAGSTSLLTQKMSWNELDDLPHHTFSWEGVDGSRVFTHFPPSDTYSSEISARELARGERRFADKAHASTSLLLFGWGDGGGGPTREMMAAARRTRDLEGSSRVELGTPQGFFDGARAEFAQPPVWAGELYLEFHRGTYTSQARTKRGNRVAEGLLHEAELWCATAAVRTGAAYPYAALDRLWKTVLLHQFHDILPGSSIAWVHREAERVHAEVADELRGIVDAALRTLAGDGDLALTVNPGAYPRAGVPAAAVGAVAEASAPATVHRCGDDIVLENARTRAVLDARGHLVSLVDLGTGREVVPAGESGNVLQLIRDTPREFDAWDIDEEDQRTTRVVDDVRSIRVADDARSVVVTRSTGVSTIEQTLRLDDATGALDTSFVIDWHERQKLLKLAFPLALRTLTASSEIQFGHVQRPIHRNTSWDVARFETVAHRWIHVGEPGFGVAISNHVVYGHDVKNDRSRAGEPMVTARLSLLRAPVYPDPDADRGRHVFDVSVLPGASIADAVREGYRRQHPTRALRGARAVAPLVASDGDGVVVETVKLAEDRSGDVVVRLYEAHGARSRATLATGFAAAAVRRVDLLERPLDDAPETPWADGRGPIELRPFELVTLRFRL